MSFPSGYGMQTGYGGSGISAAFNRQTSRGYGYGAGGAGAGLGAGYGGGLGGGAGYGGGYGRAAPGGYSGYGGAHAMSMGGNGLPPGYRMAGAPLSAPLSAPPSVAGHNGMVGCPSNGGSTSGSTYAPSTAPITTSPAVPVAPTAPTAPSLQEQIALVEKHSFYPCLRPSVYMRMMYNFNSEGRDRDEISSL